MVGINLIFANNRSTWATLIKLAVIIIGFGLLFFGNFGEGRHFWNRYTYDLDGNNNDDDDDDFGDTKITKFEGSSEFNEDYTDSVKVAELNISGGATTYKLSDSTNRLFSANTQEYFGNYMLTSDKRDSLYVLNFKMKDGKRSFNWDDDRKKSNVANFKLNVNPQWNINVATGATDLDFDLSKFKIRTLDLAGGAGAFKLKFGQPLVTTNVDISTGASEVDITIPKDAACRITKGTAFSSNNFEGFNKVGDNAYETPGFSKATNKMYIKIKGGMSSFSVKKY